MATFTQWDKSRPLRRVTFLAGPEEVLVREVSDHFAASVPASLKATYWAEPGEQEQALWNYLVSFPPSGGRLTYVFNAENLKHWDVAQSLLEPGFDLSYVVFQFNASDFPRQDKKLPEYLIPFQNSRNAQFVRCSAPAKEEDTLKLITKWWPDAGMNLASSVFRRCDGELDLIYSACKKAQRAGLPATEEAASLVCESLLSHDFADLVLEGDKILAFQDAENLDHSEVGGVLGLLASRLQLLAQLHSARMRNLSQQETAASMKLSFFIVKKYWDTAQQYAPSRIHDCEKVLAMAESAWRRGAKEGIPHAVAALW
jgi:DNA polymerase III delta subunit